MDTIHKTGAWLSVGIWFSTGNFQEYPNLRSVVRRWRIYIGHSSFHTSCRAGYSDALKFNIALSSFDISVAAPRLTGGISWF